MSSTSLLKTHVIKKLLPEEVELLFGELNNNENPWKNHYERVKSFAGPLAHGETKYIYALNVLTMETVEDNRFSYKKSIDLICKITGHNENQLGRAYWHKLKPGEHIDCHRDIDSGDSKYFNHIKRYHFYPILPEKFIIILDATLWGSNQGKDVSQSLIFFNHKDWHYYNNHSDRDLTFLVIDFIIN